MILNKSALDAIHGNLKTTFNKAFKETDSHYKKVAMEVPSKGSQNIYAWLGKFPKMRKWIGEKHVKNLEKYEYTIVNDDYESTVEVDRNDIEDDNLGLYSTSAEQVGWSSKQMPDELVFEVLEAGFTEKGYDGVSFFNTQHKVKTSNGKTVSYSNRSGVALSAADATSADASYGKARTDMMKLKDGEGRPLKVRPTILVVPPALETQGRRLLESEELADGTKNIYKGTAELLVCEHLTSDTAWYLLDMHMPVKPLIFQLRKAPKFVSMFDMGSPNVFMRKKYLFGAEARAAAGYAFWQLAFGSTGDAA